MDINNFEDAIAYMSHGMVRNTKGKKIKESKVKNMLLERQILGENIDTALRRYKINGLNDTMNERTILMAFLYRASCVFFRKNGHNYAQPAYPLGGYNMNDDPVAVYVNSKNGIINQEVNLFLKGGDVSHLINKSPMGSEIKDQTGVLVWENKSRIPFINTVINFTSAIADTYRTIDTARIWIKRPFIPVCEEQLVDGVVDMMKAIKDNEDLIPMSTGSLDITRFNVLPIDGSGAGIQSAKELIEWYQQQFRERCFMQSNTQADKKGENLTNDEIHINDEFTDTQEDNTIDYLNEQFDFVNEVLGTNLKADTTRVKQQIVKEDSKDENISGNDRQ